MPKINRLFDLFISFFLLIIFFIPIFIISIYIKLDSPGKIIYWSKRIGKNNKIFLMPKFRTMYEGTKQVSSDKLKNPNKFITKVGFFLRKTSLDELPQIYSVITGDMSIVGPRPALYNQYDLIKLRTQKGIHKFNPGITGWAQVNGRDSLTIKRKVFFDYEYSQKKNIYFDLKIIFLTITVVLKRLNINH